MADRAAPAARHPGYYADSIYPVEGGGPERRKAPWSPGLGLWPGEPLHVTRRETGRWNVMLVWRGGRLYLYSTSLVGSSDPFGLVEEVDAMSLAPIRSSPKLPTGGHISAGSIVVHANGDLYVVNGRFLHRLSPDLDVLAEVELVDDRAYNGLLVMADGTLVTKEVRLGGEPSHLTIFEPEELGSLGATTLLEASMGRMCGELDNRTDVIYVPGTERIFRYEYRRGGLKRDSTWTARYRTGGDPHGLAWDGCLGAGSIWFHDNGDPSSLRLMHEQQPTGAVARDTSFEASFAVAGRLHRFSTSKADEHDVLEPVGLPDGWVLSPPVYVESHRVAIAWDSWHGGMVAWRYSGPGEFTELWRTTLRNFWQPLVYPDTAEIVVDDYLPMVDDNIVVLDLLTGAEKARVETGSSRPNGMFPCPGQGRDFYYVTTNVVARVAAG